ncbi:TACR3 [Lepeophtheirus salmonis]|uniref:TACR3 n=1 Tax=Lepeophtheirus salmonis TaxID=72036 RepID=A0A7R8HC92_LEPSM|nr:TACR3 [Lepeophtheirus salmonis]CAF3002498.1 TACR3 [Lepeophtheirus salmonis]
MADMDSTTLFPCTTPNFSLIDDNNTNNSTTITPTSSFSSSGAPNQMSFGADMAWTTIFTIMIICAMFGNLVVFWIVLAHRRMQNVTNYFLVNLSLADLMMSCLNTIFNFIFMKNRWASWLDDLRFIVWGQASAEKKKKNVLLLHCAGSEALQWFKTIKLNKKEEEDYSQIVVRAMSEDFSPKESVLFERNWIFGSVYCKINNFMAHISVPVSVFTLVAISIDRYIVIVYPLKQRITKTVARILLILIWSGSSLLSLPSLLYSKTVTVILWGSKGSKENSAQERKLSSKRKVVKMFIVLVIIFAVCWFPYHVYFIYIYHDKDLTKKPFIQHVYLGFYWLAMANSMFNPFIYYWMNARFRGYFKSLLVSLKIIICKPKGLWRKTESKSSLNIGTFPSDPGLFKSQSTQVKT